MKKPKIDRTYLTRGGPVDEVFNKLSGPKKRVAVALDALRWLKSKTVVASLGTYIEPTADYTPGVPTDPVIDSEEGVAEICKYKCAVCAKGILFLAGITRNSGIPVSFALSRWGDDISDELCQYRMIFKSPLDLDIIEAVFEGSDIDVGERLVSPEILARWDAVYPQPGHGLPAGTSETARRQGTDLRLKAVLVNIIENKGNFNPERVPSLAVVNHVMAKV
jgi:hypothetical protein